MSYYERKHFIDKFYKNCDLKTSSMPFCVCKELSTNSVRKWDFWSKLHILDINIFPTSIQTAPDSFLRTILWHGFTVIQKLKTLRHHCREDRDSSNIHICKILINAHNLCRKLYILISLITSYKMLLWIFVFLPYFLWNTSTSS